MSLTFLLKDSHAEILFFLVLVFEMEFCLLGVYRHKSYPNIWSGLRAEQLRLWLLQKQ